MLYSCGTNFHYSELKKTLVYPFLGVFQYNKTKLKLYASFRKIKIGAT